jgi:hypothetical protein
MRDESIPADFQGGGNEYFAAPIIRFSREIDPDGVAETEADHFGNCPICGALLDMRDPVRIPRPDSPTPSAARRWGREASPVRRRAARGTLHLRNSEGTSGPRAACDDAKAGHERGRQLRRGPEEENWTPDP